MAKIFKSKNIPFDEEEKELMEAFENGEVNIIKKGKNTDKILHATLESIKSKQRKMYSFRLPVAVMDRIKEKAQKAGIPYQTLVCSALTELAK